jgi:hypothetical protein
LLFFCMTMPHRISGDLAPSASKQTTIAIRRPARETKRGSE